MEPLHVPAWAWAVTIAVVGGVIAVDLLVSYRRTRPVRMAEAAWWTLAAIALAVAFGAMLAVTAGGTSAGQFFAGWLTEYSLSLDNLLVFIILVGRSKVPRQQQGRVVLAGILLALLFRGAVIALGAAGLPRVGGVEDLFGAFLLYTAAQVVRQRSSADGPGGLSAFRRPQPAGHAAPAERPPQADPAAGPTQQAALRGSGARLAARLSRSGRVTPVVMLVIALGITDVMFAFDSIP